MKPIEPRPIRRVVTTSDARGRSHVLIDGPAPNVHVGSAGTLASHANLWVWNDSPLPLAPERDDGDLSYTSLGPARGGHLRVIQAPRKPDDYDPAHDPIREPYHDSELWGGGRTWDRGGRNAYSSQMHKSETLDYGIVLAGERVLILDDGEVTLKPGDVCVQVGAWHQWSQPRLDAIIAFDMMSARFDDGPMGLAQGAERVMVADPARRLPEGVRAPRRVVAADLAPGRSSLVADGPAPDVRLDPARPGFAAARLWVTDRTPARVVLETLHLPHTLEPPPDGSICRVLTLPPEDVWRGRVGSREVAAYFAAMGSPQASQYSADAPHPYMQRTRSIDFCVLLEGEAVLVLDEQEVVLRAGDFVIQRATRHAWANRSTRPATLAICSHDAA